MASEEFKDKHEISGGRLGFVADELVNDPGFREALSTATA